MFPIVFKRNLSQLILLKNLYNILIFSLEGRFFLPTKERLITKCVVRISIARVVATMEVK